MSELNQALKNHYLKEGLYEDILERLKNQNINLTEVTRSDLSGVDEFHVRGAQVSRELARTTNLEGKTVLDVGCGLGGPCRFLADEYNCITTGIDLSDAYVRTATLLSKLVGLENKTNFVQGDASCLPFDDESFDAVWTQHVQMNIPDKDTFYSEIYRVLKPNGYLLYYDIFSTGTQKVSYPMPWAGKEEHSFLVSNLQMEELVKSLGFSELDKQDQTPAGIAFFKDFIAKLGLSGPPKLGLNVLMGESTKPKLFNLYTHLDKGVLMLQSGVFIK
ncbi:MAG: class I SAM-dependent methyltransferase [Gilvibacter sp.]